MWKEKQIHNPNRNCKWCDRKHVCNGLCARCNRLKPRLDLMDLLGGRECVRCGFCDTRALQIEHKNGGGRKDAKKFINNYYMYKFYLNNVEKAKDVLQVMCSNCNWIKRYQNNEV